jgi:hypothetical protein
MPWVALHPPLEEAREAVQEVMTAAVVITSTRITNTRFIIVVFRVKKGTRQTVCLDRWIGGLFMGVGPQVL